MTARAGSDLVASVCEVDEFGVAITDPAGATSYPGVYVIGTASNAWAHLAHAAAAGTAIGPIVTMYLLEQQIAKRREHSR
jgi:thioredoxin reductase